jgi:uncharacterized protein (DUF433 family)
MSDKNAGSPTIKETHIAPYELADPLDEELESR